MDIIKGCYPLNPVSTFILPRLSEKVAQNERTLFTFLSAPGKVTLSGFLARHSEEEMTFITPDLIYDYFEPLMRKEIYASEMYETYYLTSVILKKLDSESLEAKIVKSISLIYILGQFEKLKPTTTEISGIYEGMYDPKEIFDAIDNLVEKEYVVYLKRSNNFLQLKQTSGINVNQKISDKKEVQRRETSVKDILNKYNFNNYIYPSRYNDEREMTRYFSFQFIKSNEVTEEVDWEKKSDSVVADGIIYGIIPDNESEIDRVKEILTSKCKKSCRCVFALPKKYKNFDDIIREFNAVIALKNEAKSDPVLFDEYEVIYEDLKEVVENYINTYTYPEKNVTSYYYEMKKKKITRKSELSRLISGICDIIYSRTPIINNEVINLENPVGMAVNSRNKIVSALLRDKIEPNLGFSGNGQEVSIMRSTLLRTGVVKDNNGLISLNLSVENDCLKGMLGTIEAFIIQAKECDKVCFEKLYKRLQSPEYHIGMRKGPIPIYLAVVMHMFKQHIMLQDRYGEIDITAETLMQINAKPENYYLTYVEWNSDRENYIHILEECFVDYIFENEKELHPYEYIVDAMQRWYLGLPKYAKDIKRDPSGEKIDKCNRRFVLALKQHTGTHELLFKTFPDIFNEDINSILASKIKKTKFYYDNLLDNLKINLT